MQIVARIQAQRLKLYCAARISVTNTVRVQVLQIRVHMCQRLESVTLLRQRCRWRHAKRMQKPLQWKHRARHCDVHVLALHRQHEYDSFSVLERCAPALRSATNVAQA